MPSFITQPSYDTDASTFFTTAGVTSTQAKQQISRFATGVKDLGLWSSMVCWPLRSLQNPGGGSTVYSLGGYGAYNGTINGTVSRQLNGMFYPDDNSFKNINTALNQSFNSSNSCFAVGALIGTSSQFRRYIGTSTQAASELTAYVTAAYGTTLYALNVWSESVGSDVVLPSGDLSTFNWLGLSFNYATGTNNVEGQRNTNFATVSRATSTPSTRAFQIGGGQTTSDTFTGTMSFAAYFPTTVVSQANKLALYNLYKTTLGVGLDLP
jgi:hypothetical protein